MQRPVGVHHPHATLGFAPRGGRRAAIVRSPIFPATLPTIAPADDRIRRFVLPRCRRAPGAQCWPHIRRTFPTTWPPQIAARSFDTSLPALPAPSAKQARRHPSRLPPFFLTHLEQCFDKIALQFRQRARPEILRQFALCRVSPGPAAPAQPNALRRLLCSLVAAAPSAPPGCCGRG